MIRKALLAVLACVPASATALAQAAPPPSAPAAVSCRLNQIAALDITLGPGGAVTVPMSIGAEKVTMLFNTGASVSMLSEATARRLDLHQLPINTYLSASMGRMARSYAIVKNVALDRLTAPSWNFGIMPAAMPPNLDGMLGADMIRDYGVELDLARMKINIFTAPSCDSGPVYWTKDAYAKVPFKLNGGLIEFPIQLDGKEITAILNTAAPVSASGLETMRAVFRIDAGDPGLTPLPRGSAKHYPFKTLSVDSLSVANPEIILMPEVNANALYPRMTLGMSVLRQLHTFVDYKNQALYFTPASAN